jgi:SAM-dependent methyltransferase
MAGEAIRLGRFVDRVQYGVELSVGKSVLHIGCTGGDRSQDPDESVHAKLHSVARECIGIDILDEQVARLKSRGYDVLVADAEDFSLPKKNFDMIYAGEVIEHLSNPGHFLVCANQHLVLNGQIVLTTPQPLTFGRFMMIVVADKYSQPHGGHVCWYDPFLLAKLLERYGFNVMECHPSGLRECGPIERILIRIRKNLAPGFVILATKKSESRFEGVRRITKESQITV